jgi:outer membrane protein assembly factor BamB
LRRRDLSNTGRAPKAESPDPTDLSEKWQFTTENSEVNIPILKNGLLVVSASTPDGDIFGVDPQTGSQQWVSRYDSPLSIEPVFVDESIFAAHSGIRRTLPIHKVRGELQAPTVDPGRPTVLRSTGDELVLARKRTSEQDWHVDLLGVGPGGNAPTWRYRPRFENVAPDWTGAITDVALRDGIVYAGGHVCREESTDVCLHYRFVAAYDPESGEELWKHGENGDTISIAVDANRVYAFSFDRSGTIAYDRASGEVAWRADTNAPGGGPSYPAIGANTLYVGRGTSLVALQKPTGEIQWETDLNATAVRPSIGGDAVYTVANRLTDRPAKFVALERQTGEKLFETTFSASTITAPAIGNGAVFVGVEDGTVRKYA